MNCLYRKQMAIVLHEYLLADCVTYNIVSCVLTQYSKLHTDCDAFISTIAEVISDIREPLTDSESQHSDTLSSSESDQRQANLKVRQFTS